MKYNDMQIYTHKHSVCLTNDRRLSRLTITLPNVKLNQTSPISFSVLNPVLHWKCDPVALVRLYSWCINVTYVNVAISTVRLIVSQTGDEIRSASKYCFN